MQPRIRVLAVSLAAALTLVSVGCGTEGKGDDASPAGKKDTTTTVAGNTTIENGDDPVATTEPSDDDPFVPSGDDGKAGPYVDAMKRSLHASNEEDGDFQLTDGQIDCMAPRFVDIMDVDRLEANGVTPADLESDESMDFSKLKMSEDEGNALYDTFGDCDINLSELMMTSMASEGDMTPELQECMKAVFTDDNLRLLMVTSMVKGEDAAEDDPALAPIMAQMMGCAFMGMEDMGDGSTDMPSSEPGN